MHGVFDLDASEAAGNTFGADVCRTVGVPFVGWSDGACIALVLASQAPSRVAGVFFFACNMDPSGAKPITELTPILARCLSRHAQDYAWLSDTPEQFDALSDAVGQMQQTQPNYAAHDLERISVPVAIVQSEHDEFIWPQHAEYLARTIPRAALDELVASGAERGLQVAVYRHGKRIVDAVAGVADPTTGRLVTADTPFFSYSIGQSMVNAHETQHIFGVGGVGGSHAYADTATGVTFALTKSRLAPSFETAERVAAVVEQAMALRADA